MKRGIVFVPDDFCDGRPVFGYERASQMANEYLNTHGDWIEDTDGELCLVIKPKYLEEVTDPEPKFTFSSQLCPDVEITEDSSVDTCPVVRNSVKTD